MPDALGMFCYAGDAYEGERWLHSYTVGGVDDADAAPRLSHARGVSRFDAVTPADATPLRHVIYFFADITTPFTAITATLIYQQQVRVTYNVMVRQHSSALKILSRRIAGP